MLNEAPAASHRRAACAGLALWTCLLLAPLLSAQQARPEDALRAFHAAAARADLDAYLALLTDDVVFLGTDASERWQGQAFRDFVRGRFADGEGWTYRQLETRIDADRSGRFARFDELLDNEHLGTCRGSGLLVNTANGWRIAQYNLSVPIPNDMVFDIAAGIRAEPEGTMVSDEPAAVDTTATANSPAAATATDDEPGPERKRCRKRHKTNRVAGC